MSQHSNPEIELAYNYVQYTDKNIFLTGKAGTGKTTFLQRIREESLKRSVVVAPTGVAAINAKGMTIHSCFQLPFGPFIPNSPNNDLSRKRRFRKEKIKLIKSIDLLIIDEISMVRSDVLDSIDEVLRRFKNRNLPFGGVQLLLIGDLYQLPPVVKRNEWQMLREYYDTPYFFGSKALQASSSIMIELKHIYRQSDQIFIDLLNKVRNKQLDQQVLDTLNSRYIADFAPDDNEGYITLSSHNATAKTINDAKLATLTNVSLKFEAEIEGDFPEHAYPTDFTLELKQGAQVMFVKNDMQPEKRFYNGKIGKIVGFDEEQILVQCPNETQTIYVGRSEWENIQYTLNEETKEVEEEIKGRFLQYPLKLAWAITIHKSQGLTFEKVIIDAGESFAHGQVYVALSRCKSFEGIVLRSKINHSGVKTDAVVQSYSKNSEKNAPNQTQLEQAKKEYEEKLIVELFGFKQIIGTFNKLKHTLNDNERSLDFSEIRALDSVYETLKNDLIEVSNNFKIWLESQFYHSNESLPRLNGTIHEKIKKACVYYLDKLNNGVIPAFDTIAFSTDNQKLFESIEEKLLACEKQFYIKKKCFESTISGFSTNTYIQKKIDAELAFDDQQTGGGGTPQKPKKISVPKDILHPVLYKKLLEWRNKLAKSEGLTTFEILPVKMLKSIDRYLPTGTNTFKKIDGFGDIRLKKYGKDIADIVDEYCHSAGVIADLNVQDVAFFFTADGEKRNTKDISFAMFEAGKSIDEITKIRNLQQSTIEGHLAYFIEKGKLDIFTIVDNKTVQKISNYFAKKKNDSLSDAKIHFGSQFSYGELKMVQKYWKKMNE